MLRLSLSQYYMDLHPLALPLLGIIFGLVALIWSADKFIDGAAATARHFKMPCFLIGMLIVGVGTSAPEIFVSAMSALDANPGIALGNAYGSNISNIALILGLTALITPVVAHSRVMKKELPLLTLITLLAIYQAWDGVISRWDATILFLVFVSIVGHSIWSGYRTQKQDDAPIKAAEYTLPKSLTYLFVGLFILMGSSRLLVWGSVECAQYFGVSDLIIGLTIIAIGTSLPELASTIAATRKGEHDIALGNILGSNMFNTLLVVGVGAAIHPITVQQEVIERDMSLMLGLTLSLFFVCAAFKGDKGLVNRYEGGALALGYFVYLGVLVYHIIGA